MLAIAAVGCAGAGGAQQAVAFAWPCTAGSNLVPECGRGGGRDSDGDGWPDALEELFGTSAADADTDGDGIEDAADRCPLLSDEDARLAPALHVVAGVLASEAPVIVALGPEGPRVCFDAIAGVQLHGREGPWDYATLHFWGTDSIPRQPAEGDAVVIEARLGGVMSGCTFRVRLAYQEGRWVQRGVERTLCA
ncbi:MAG TPA: thrombospondin type 3 repeat-containing protein [Sandaracinaceae bacterium]